MSYEIYINRQPSQPVNMPVILRDLAAAGIEVLDNDDSNRVWVAPRDVGPAVEVINAAGYTTDEDDNSAEIAADAAVENELNAPPPASWRGETEKVIEHLRHHIGGVEDMGWLSESNDVHALATHMQSYYCNVFPDPHIKWGVVAKWYAQRHDCAADE
jgi:hypothetical protein